MNLSEDKETEVHTDLYAPPPGGPACDNCGQTFIYVSCKSRCTRCGFIRDCTD